MKRLFVKEIAMLLVLALLIPMFGVAEDVEINLTAGDPEPADFLEVPDIGEIELEEEATGDDLQLDELPDELTIDELPEVSLESDGEAEIEENVTKKYGVPTQLTLGVKETFALKYTQKDLTYNSSAPKIVKVNTKGTVTALKKGKATITVYSKKKKLTTCKVTVLDAPDSITLSGKSRKMVVGSAIRLTPTMPKNTASKITWTSSKKSVATVDADGVVRALKKGTVNITARTFNGKKAVCKITVGDGASYLVFETEALSIGVKEKVALKPEVNEGAKVKYTWSVKDKKVATVNQKGVVTGVKAGKTTVTVKTQNGLTATVTVTVLAAPGKVALNKKKAELPENQTLQLKATLPKKTASQIKWSSSNKKVATVDKDGLVTAVAPGEATITAKTFNGKTATCVVTVTEGSALDYYNMFFEAYESEKDVDTDFMDLQYEHISADDFDDSEEMRELIEDYNGLISEINADTEAFYSAIGDLMDAFDALDASAGKTSIVATEDSVKVETGFLDISTPSTRSNSIKANRRYVVNSSQEDSYEISETARKWSDGISKGLAALSEAIDVFSYYATKMKNSARGAMASATSLRNKAKATGKGLNSAKTTLKAAIDKYYKWDDILKVAHIAKGEVVGCIISVSDASFQIGAAAISAKYIHDVRSHGHPAVQRENDDDVRLKHVEQLNESLAEADKAIKLNIGFNVATIVIQVAMLGKGKIAKLGAQAGKKYLKKKAMTKLTELTGERWIKNVWYTAGEVNSLINDMDKHCGQVTREDDILDGITRGTISGTVIDAGTKKPIEGVLVETDEKSTYTNADGSFALSVKYGMYAGKYAVKCTKNGYQEACGEAEIDVDRSDAVITVEMEPSGFYFGHYEQDNDPSNGMEPIEWIELERNGDTVRLISKYGLDVKKYNNDYLDTTWATCTLRSWLNSTFLNTAFTSEEQERIQTTTVINEDNPVYGTTGGSTTQDKVFLLSISEAREYFPSDSARECYTTEALDKGFYTQGTKGVSGPFIRNWWLRSPGKFEDCAAYVLPSGRVFEDGFSAWVQFPVRPVIVLSLS